MRKNKPSIAAILLWGFFLVLAGFAFWSFYQLINSFQRARVDVEWSTASELDTVGFNLYRSDSSSGNLERVNKDLIPCSGDALTGGEYNYADTSVQPGKIYYYYLEDVDIFGNTHRNGPITVKANAASWLEILLAIALLLVAFGGMGILIHRMKKP